MGHWVQIIGLLLLALLVFGPKRMVEMGSSLGKAFREFRDSTKDLNFSQILSGTDNDDEDTTARITPIAPVTPHIVEGSIEHSVEAEKPATSDQ
ncbi:MAG TPA: twin-arginine translocase TatA/TatE family subunit [Ktedonobacterales bacterium]|nr:twin-arginine translocase TatA/TatE family subunit [Ktedonobacterales bacterium]